MTMQSDALRRGDLVEVIGPAEILATLDESGALESLPFMAEMASLCGRRFVVAGRAERVCDTIQYTGTLNLPDTVLLDDLRCDGCAHGGCQAECRYFWKEAWVRKVSKDAPPPAPFLRRDLDALLQRANRGARRTVGTNGSTQERWRCQATELPRASKHVRVLDARSYVKEYTSGNVGLGQFLRVTARAAVQEPMRKLGLVPDVPLPGSRTGPGLDPPLDLQPGELVAVKSKEEIALTLNARGKHRGLWFDREMIPLCGRTFRVRKRIQRIIDERDGRMIEMKNDCVTLEGGVCSGERSLGRWFCPRAIFPYWRESWLRRVEAP
jgi:hypothetical protein